MPRFTGTVRTHEGRAVSLATVYVFDAGSNTPRAIFTDFAMTLPKANPFVANQDGTYDFYTPPGNIKIMVVRDGALLKIVDNIPVPATDFSSLQVRAKLGLNFPGPFGGGGGTVVIIWDGSYFISPSSWLAAPLPQSTLFAPVKGAYLVGFQMGFGPGSASTVLTVNLGAIAAYEADGTNAFPPGGQESYQTWGIQLLNAGDPVFAAAAFLGAPRTATTDSYLYAGLLGAIP